MDFVITVVHLILIIAMIAVILLQRSEGGALGIGGGGGGGGGGLFTARGSANVLTRATAFLALGFFATSLGLGILAKNAAGPSNLLDSIPVQEGGSATGVPLGGGEGGILDELEGLSPPAEGGGVSGPQVPGSE